MYKSTEARTRQCARPREEAIVSMNVLDMRLLFLLYWNEKDCHLSIWVILDMFAQLLAIQLANTWVQDLPTAKIIPVKISETQILACFAKIYTHKHYKSYGTDHSGI